MVFSDQSYSPKKLKREINIQQAFAYFGIEINEYSKCKCPFHNDDDPSMLVNSEFAYCFACGKGWDIFDFLKEHLGLEFQDTIKWLVANKDNLPEVEIKSRTRGEYRGPVPTELVEYWNTCLTEEHREVLHKTRLLNDDFIDQWLIGWRPDWNAFSIPFWRGKPQDSEVDIVQFRLSDDSPEMITKYVHDSKFIGLSGHNRPSLIGVHSLLKWGIMLFGTFDAALAIQDGFSCVSPNGASVFVSKKAKPALHKALEGVETLYVVYDSTESERKVARKTVTGLSCNVIEKEFTTEKDYGDYRLTHSPEDFIRDILGWKVW